MWNGEAVEIERTIRTVTIVPQSPRLTIRPATKDDVRRLLALIYDLAQYKRMTHEVTATEES